MHCKKEPSRCSETSLRQRETRLERYFFDAANRGISVLPVFGLVPWDKGLAGAFMWGIGDPFGK